MYDTDDLHRRAMLAAMMAKLHDLSEVLLQSAGRLPRCVVRLSRLMAGTQSDCWRLTWSQEGTFVTARLTAWLTGR